MIDNEKENKTNEIEPKATLVYKKISPTFTYDEDTKTLTINTGE